MRDVMAGAAWRYDRVGRNVVDSSRRLILAHLPAGMGDETHANGAMMAAAPDLLRECETAQKVFAAIIRQAAEHGLPGHEEAARRIHESLGAAIAKATGGRS